jgi:exonuclease 3'-5' domain-containing protein 1
MRADETTLKWIDTAQLVVELIEVVQKSSSQIPDLYIDMEGISLSRHGSISLMNIFVPSQNCIYLVDIHALQSEAFTAATMDGATLKSTLESPAITKVFFDVRNDSDALHHHFGVRLQGVEDVQLMENATRPANQRRYVSGLEKCIETYAPIPPMEKLKWKSVKEKGLKLFHPNKGGSYEVFNVRPIDPDIMAYCTNDVLYLPQLRNLFWARLNKTWKENVTEETKKRMTESQSTTYLPQSEGKKYGPWNLYTV